MKSLMTNVVRLVAAMTITLAVTATLAHAGETMTDRCSSEVAIVPAFGDQPDTIGTIILKRGPNGTTDWTPPFTVQLSSVGAFAGGVTPPLVTHLIPGLGESKT